MAEKENIHKGHRQRMWKKYLDHGIECFEEHELLEILLFSCYTRRNTNDIAHALIERFGSLESVMNASVNELCEVENVGPSAAANICFISDLAKKMSSKMPDNVRLSNSEEMREYCTKLLIGSKIEMSYVLYLDQSSVLLAQQRLAKGTAVAVEFDVRTIAEKAIKLNCRNVVLVHNHPGGISIASSADVATTRRVSNALLNLGISVTDHIIVAGDDSYSMRRAKLLPDIWD